jgi:hypothetical protein
VVLLPASEADEGCGFDCRVEAAVDGVGVLVGAVGEYE